MRKTNVIQLSALAVCMALAGCLSVPTAQTGMQRLGDREVNADVAQKGTLSLTIKEQPKKGYKVNYVRITDWDVAKATLSKVKPVYDGDGNITGYVADPTFTPVEKTGNAGVNAADQTRSASITMTGMNEGPNYVITVQLIKKAATGDKTIASGSNTGISGAGFSILGGANNVTVPISFTADGEAQISVPEPGLNTSLSVSASTDSNFSVVRIAGSGGNAVNTYPVANNTALNLYTPSGIVIDKNGDTLVSDLNRHQIVKIAAAGGTTVFAGLGAAGTSGDGGDATAANLSSPYGLAYIPSSDTVLLADSGNHRIRKIVGGKIYGFAGGGSTVPGAAGTTLSPATTAQLNNPIGVCADKAGNVYIAESGAGRVCKVDTNGDLTVLATGVTAASGIAIDLTNQILFVTSNDVIRKITLGTAPIATGIVYDDPNNSARWRGLAYDQNGVLYASQTGDGTSYWGRYHNRLYRVPVDNSGADKGSLLTGRAVEVVGGMLADVYTGAVVSATTVPNALNASFTGFGGAGLCIDMRKSNADTSTTNNLSGILYSTNFQENNNGGQVLKFTPNGL